MIKISKSDFFSYIRSGSKAQLGINYKTEELEAFERLPVRSDRYYLRYFDKVRFGMGIIKWNWSAFLFSYMWLAYRKMYAPLFALALFAAVYFPSTLLVMLFLGFFGDYIYLQSVILRRQRESANRGVSVLAALFGTLFITLLAGFSAWMFFR